MKLVRQMKEYGDIRVANALYGLGYRSANPRRRPTNIEKMVEGLPRHVLQSILDRLGHSIGRAT